MQLALLSALVAATLGVQSPDLTPDRPRPEELRSPGAEARALWESGASEAAIERALATLARAPNPELRALVARWEMAVHRPAAALEHMAADDPLRGLALIALGRCEEALALLDPARTEHIAPRVECLHRLGRLEEASAAARAAESLLGEGHPLVLVWRGRAAAELGDWEAAIGAYRGALARDPIHMGALFGLGRALVRAGDVEEGRRVLARHRELVPIVDAYDFASQTLALRPTHAPTLAHVAELEAQLGLADAARAHFADAERRAKFGEHVPIALRHARFHEEGGDAEAGLAILVRALQTGDDVSLRVRAGDVLARLGRVEEAREQYRAALQAAPGHASIQRRLAELGSE